MGAARSAQPAPPGDWDGNAVSTMPLFVGVLCYIPVSASGCTQCVALLSLFPRLTTSSEPASQSGTMPFVKVSPSPSLSLSLSLSLAAGPRSLTFFLPTLVPQVEKSKAYFKRYQVKFRRRREGKTDYRARKRLISQDKNKYNAPKYRLVVRLTSKYVICQIAYATIQGDRIMCAANSKELVRYGLKTGLKNYAAAYCTGLLCARRLLQKLGMDEMYKGQDEEVTGEIVKTEAGKRTYYVDELDDDKRPFRAILDVGIQSTTTGNRVFAAMKGATDGGLDVPHSEKRFPGYDRDTKEFDAEVHHDRIFNQHVAEYMEYLQEEDEALYKTQFSSYISNDVAADTMEEYIEAVHEAIRADPSPAPKSDFKGDSKYKKPVKKTYEQRKADAAAKKAALRAAAEDED
jgi:large subunit ribosomal protein L5e